jgi:N6-adenosine-specific RNA methylase IME4
LPFRDQSQRSWQTYPRRQHSEKPEEVRAIIERVSPGPYLEIFGRRTAPGWIVFGNQIERNLFDRDIPEIE